MLREYTTIQQKVLACIIKEEGKLKELEKGKWEYKHKGKGAAQTLLIFSVNAGKKPKFGDAIMFQSKDDIYHCPKKVFDAKYASSGMSVL